MNLYDLLVQSADAGLDLQTESGAMPAGHNGPWNDSETPVRNTSHWTITFLKAHEITEEPRFYEGAQRCVEYLCKSEARPNRSTFHHRKVPNKDACNGLIGQAWTIEALSIAADRLEQPELAQLAEEVFLEHPFDDVLSVWKPVEIDGTVLEVDMTLNHQIWFAAGGAVLTQNNECSELVTERVEVFFDELADIFATYQSGLIHHHLKPGTSLRKQGRVQMQNLRKRRIPQSVVQLYRPGTGQALRRRAVGYHSFNLYGLGLLYTSFPKHPFWECSKFKKAIEFATSEQFLSDLTENQYGYPYNVSGLELAYAYHVFGSGTELIQNQISKQLQDHFDPNMGLLNQQTSDQTTLAARLYEATRLPNISFTDTV